MKIRNILTLILAVTATIFILQNAGSVDIRFLFWSTALSLSILLVMMVALGFLLGWFIHFLAVRTKNKEADQEEIRKASKKQ